VQKLKLKLLNLVFLKINKHLTKKRWLSVVVGMVSFPVAFDVRPSRYGICSLGLQTTKGLGEEVLHTAHSTWFWVRCWRTSMKTRD
jgi:hypothetical protein